MDDNKQIKNKKIGLIDIICVLIIFYCIYKIVCTPEDKMEDTWLIHEPPATQPAPTPTEHPFGGENPFMSKPKNNSNPDKNSTSDKKNGI